MSDLHNEGKLFAALDETADLVQTSTQLQPGDLGAAFIKMFLSLIFLVVLLFLSYWFLKRFIQNRFQKGGGDGAIQILEKRMISPKTMLYLVEVDKKRVLFSESHLEVKRLENFELSDPHP